MFDFDNNADNLYSSYKEAMDKIAKNKAELERLEKKGEPKNTFDMKQTGFSPNINWIDAHRKHLHLVNEKTTENVNNKIQLYCEKNNISKDGQRDLVKQFSERYENEQIKNLDQSQEHSLHMLEKQNAQKEIAERQHSKGNSLEQSQENAKTLLDMRHEQTKQVDEVVTNKDGLGNYNYNMELSFNKMEQHLEEKVKEENELEQGMEVDRDADVDKE
jgi:hypothetical protein